MSHVAKNKISSLSLLSRELRVKKIKSIKDQRNFVQTHYLKCFRQLFECSF